MLLNKSICFILVLNRNVIMVIGNDFVYAYFDGLYSKW